MGTSGKITGTLVTAISKVSGVAISNLSHIMGQVISLFSNSAQSLTFDGVDDYVEVGNDSSLRATTTITYNVWVHRDDWVANTGIQAIVGNFKANTGIYIRWKSRRIQCFARILGGNQQIRTGYNQFRAGYTYGTGNDGWHMITITWDGQYFLLYINGSLATDGGAYDNYDAGSSGNVIDYDGGVGNTYEVTIGKQAAGSSFFDGSIDEVSIWDAALDADAITVLFNSGVPINLNSDSGNYDNSGDLQGWWRFESGEEMVDSSTNSNTGTQSGGVTNNSDVPD